MLIAKKQLTGLAMIAGLTIAAATGCRKESVKPVNAVHSQMVEDSADGSGDEDGPKFPPHPAWGRVHSRDTLKRLKRDGSGDEDGPKFPPHTGIHVHPGCGGAGSATADDSGDEDGPKFPPHVSGN